MSEKPRRFAPERLLVGLDEDGCSDPALRAAARLTEIFRCPAQLIHAVSVGTPRWWKVDPVSLATANAEELTRSWTRISRHVVEAVPGTAWQDCDLSERIRVLPGNPACVLSDQASAKDLILIGPHHERGILDFGNTARAVLAQAPCPVWIQCEDPQDIRRILVPLDLSEESLLPLEIARGIAERLGARVIAMHCFAGHLFDHAPEVENATTGHVVDGLHGAAEERMGSILESFPWHGVEFESRFVEADPVEHILASQDSADLLVMGMRGEGGFGSPVLGSTTYGVLRESRIPVLAVRSFADRKDG